MTAPVTIDFDEQTLTALDGFAESLREAQFVNA